MKGLLKGNWGQPETCLIERMIFLINTCLADEHQITCAAFSPYEEQCFFFFPKSRGSYGLFRFSSRHDITTGVICVGWFPPCEHTPLMSAVPTHSFLALEKISWSRPHPFIPPYPASLFLFSGRQNGASLGKMPQIRFKGTTKTHIKSSKSSMGPFKTELSLRLQGTL